MSPLKANRPAFQDRSRALSLGLLAAAAMTGLGLLATVSVHAADPASPARAGRYTMSPADGGFVRLDTLTGAMAMCRRSGTGAEADWACEDMRDESAKLRADNERLLAENAALKAENRRLEETLLGPDPKDGERNGTSRPGPAFKLPSEQDVDQAFSYLQGMLKKFREKLEELEKTTPREKKETPL